jgi:hydrogenase-4 membrane subunit HyfE
MTYVLIALLVALVAPLLTASWRISLVSLGAQGLLMTALVASRGWPTTASGAVLLVDLFVLRTWFVPRHLIRILRSKDLPVRDDLIPANLLSWTLAAAAVLVAFRFATYVEPGGGDVLVLVAVATAGLLLGFLILASQVSVFSQIVGVLRVEYAVGLLELAAGREPPLPVQLGTTAVLFLSVLTLGGFLRRFGTTESGSSQAAGGSTP